MNIGTISPIDRARFQGTVHETDNARFQRVRVFVKETVFDTNLWKKVECYHEYAPVIDMKPGETFGETFIDTSQEILLKKMAMLAIFSAPFMFFRIFSWMGELWEGKNLSSLSEKIVTLVTLPVAVPLCAAIVNILAIIGVVGSLINWALGRESDLLYLIMSRIGQVQRLFLRKNWTLMQAKCMNYVVKYELSEEKKLSTKDSSHIEQWALNAVKIIRENHDTCLSPLFPKGYDPSSKKFTSRHSVPRLREIVYL